MAPIAAIQIAAAMPNGNSARGRKRIASSGG